MSGADIREPRHRHRRQASRRTPGRPGSARLRRLSDRTPLRTKLITAVLALVIMALAAISVASVYMLRGYVTTQRDNAQLAFSRTSRRHRRPRRWPA